MNYLIESVILVSLFFLVYTILKFSLSIRSRRVLLLCLLACAIIIPALEIDLITSGMPLRLSFPQPIPADFIPVRGKIVSSESTAEEPITTTKYFETKKIGSTEVNWVRILTLGYTLLVVVLLGRLAYGLLSVFKLKSKSKRCSKGDIIYYETRDSKLLGASFFNLLFLSESLDVAERRNLVLYHEETHSKLLHSIDMVLAEVYCCFFWFNPVSWLIKKEINLVTEYEADEHTSMRFGRQEYSTELVNLVARHQSSPLLHPFAQRSMHQRLSQLRKGQIKNRWYTLPTIGMTFIVGLYFFGCQNADDFFHKDFIGQSPDNVKKITTTYVSHQSDTQQKDGQIIAIANFKADGGLENLTEYTSYPYDHKKPVEHEFITSPQVDNLPHFMDGLDLRGAKNNLLYGNDWSMVYMNSAHTMDPRLGHYMERRGYKRDVRTNGNNYPNQVFEGNRAEDGTILEGYIKDFEYQENRITRFIETHVMSTQFLEDVRIDGFPAEIDQGWKQVMTDRRYIYDEDNLISVLSNDRETRFTYESDLIKTSEFYIKGKLFNHRIYFYNEAGLKTKTEIYNVDDEPEYTIYYDYEFWED